MMLPRSLRVGLTALVFVPLVAASLYACSDDTTDTTPPDEELKGYEDVIYEGEVTDEALVSLVSALEQGPKDDPAQAPTLVSPMGEVPKTPIPTFTWKIGSTAARSTPPTLLRWAEHDSDRAPPRFTAGLRDLIGPERAAHAHGTPYTGQATWAVFSSASDPKLVRVLTSKTTYTPAAAAWDKIAAAGGTITLTLIGAQFDQNRIATDGGPYKGSATTFTVK